MTCCSVGLGGKWRKKSGRNNGRRKLGRELQGAQRYKTTRLLLVWIQCRSISNQPCEQAVHVGGWGGGHEQSQKSCTQKEIWLQGVGKESSSAPCWFVTRSHMLLKLASFATLGELSHRLSVTISILIVPGSKHYYMPKNLQVTGLEKKFCLVVRDL